MNETWNAPFTPEQQAALQAHQDSIGVHPYTCPDHSYVALIVLRHGLKCPALGCGYLQTQPGAYPPSFEPATGGQERSRTAALYALAVLAVAAAVVGVFVVVRAT